MRTLMRICSIRLSTLACLLVAGSSLAAVASTTKKKEVPVICRDLSESEMPVVAVADFVVKAEVSPQVGHGMATMLSNALQSTGCFQVVERERLRDVMAEQALGQSGAVEEETAPTVGKLAGAQFQFMGEITAFSDAAEGAKVGGVLSGLLKHLPGGRSLPGTVIGDLEMRAAEVNFSIKIVDTSSGKILDSGEWQTKRRSVGVAATTGSPWWQRGFQSIGASGFKSQAIADAVSDGIIKASAELADSARSQMVARSKVLRDAIAQSEGHSAKPDRNACAALGGGRPPTIMVIIPEEHILGEPGSYVARDAYVFERHNDRGSSGREAAIGSDLQALALRFIRPPDPAGETEIVKRLTEYGFTVVDSSSYADQLHDERFRRAGKDAAIAAAFGAQYKADIVISGEAFSEFSKNLNGMMSCRARVEAKAVEVSTGRILAADGLHGSGLDNSEVIAGKTALRNAGAKVADYFISRICASGVSGQAAGNTDAPSSASAATKVKAAAGDAQPASSSGSAPEPTVYLIVTNTTFDRVSDLQAMLERTKNVTGVKKEYFKDGEVRLAIRTTREAGAIADVVQGAGPTLKLQVMSFEKDTVQAAAR